MLRAFHGAGIDRAEASGNRVSFDVFRYRGPGLLTYEAAWSRPAPARSVYN